MSRKTPLPAIRIPFCFTVCPTCGITFGLNSIWRETVDVTCEKICCPNGHVHLAYRSAIVGDDLVYYDETGILSCMMHGDFAVLHAVLTCVTCYTKFAPPIDLVTAKMDAGETFYCPAGHGICKSAGNDDDDGDDDIDSPDEPSPPSLKLPLPKRFNDADLRGPKLPTETPPKIPGFSENKLRRYLRRLGAAPHHPDLISD